MESVSRRAVLHWAGVSGLAGLAGCNAFANQREASPTSRDVMANPEYVRGCTESVTGSLSAGWQERATIIGPLAFINKWAETAQFETVAAGLGHVVKVGVNIQNEHAATVVLPEAEREHIALSYNYSGFRDTTPQQTDPTRYRLADGEVSVRFEGCPAEERPSGWTSFNGGFLLNKPRCVTLDVWVYNENDPRQTTLAFGTQCE